MKILSSQQCGALYAISSGLCYGLVGYFGMSLIQAHLSIPTMLFWRFFVATLFVGLLLISQYKKFLPLLFNRQTVQVFLYGLFFYGVSTTAYFRASVYLGTGLAMVIFFTFPAVVMLINALFYNTSIQRLYYLAFGLIACGMVCLVNPENFLFDLNGIALGITSAILYACYVATSKKISVHPLISTFMVSVGCMMTSLLFALFSHSLEVPQSMPIWIDIVCMGLICTAIPILLLLQCFKYISSEQASMLSVLEPVFVLLFGFLLLDEKVNPMEFFGIIIILSGAIITIFNKKEEIQDEAKELQHLDSL